MKLLCNNCGHTWYSRTPRKPVVCPRCKSYHWYEKKEEINAGVGTTATNQIRPTTHRGADYELVGST